MNEQTVTGEVTRSESGFLERVAARQARAQKSYLQKVHGRSKYVVHQGAREKARRLRQALAPGSVAWAEHGFAEYHRESEDER